MTPERDAVTRARQRVWDVYSGDDRCRSGRDMPEALDAYRAALLAEVVAVVAGMRRWDMVDIDGIEWNIGHDDEGEYLYRSDTLTAIRALTEAK